MTEVTFEVISPVGALVRTFDQAEAARRWVFQNKIKLPGLSVVEVQTVVIRRAIYTPRRKAA